MENGRKGHYYLSAVDVGFISTVRESVKLKTGHCIGVGVALGFKFKSKIQRSKGRRGGVKLQIVL